MNDNLLNNLEAYWYQSAKEEGFDFADNSMSDDDYQKGRKILCDMIDMIRENKSA